MSKTLTQKVIQMAKKEVVPYFQKIVSSGDKQVSSYEVLGRMRNQDGKIESPYQFMPELITEHRMAEFDLAIAKAALTVARSWHTAIPVSLNASDELLHSRHNVEELISIIAASRFPKELITIEVLEQCSLCVGNCEFRNLSLLADTGIKIAFDDFPCYKDPEEFFRFLDHPSSKSAFRRGRIKLDKNEVTDHLATMSEYVAWYVKEAHQRGMDVVAEGVEEEQQGEILTQLGVDHLQGYFYGKPAESIYAH